MNNDNLKKNLKKIETIDQSSNAKIRINVEQKNFKVVFKKKWCLEKNSCQCLSLDVIALTIVNCMWDIEEKILKKYAFKIIIEKKHRIIGTKKTNVKSMKLEERLKEC